MNTSELINALKIHGSFPTSNDLFTPADFLVLFNHQMKIDITPLMMKLNEEYFVQYKNFTIEPGKKYRIPARAIGTNIRDLKYVDLNGQENDIVRLFEEDRAMNKSGFYIVRNSVELSKDYTSGTLRMAVFARPSTLVLQTDCATVLDIDQASNSIEVDIVPAGLISGVKADLVQSINPYDLLSYDEEVGVSGNTITFNSLPDGLEVGDYLCLSMQAPVPMIPEELHPVLVQSALCKALSSKKDKQWENEMNVLTQNKIDATNLLTPRVQNQSEKMRSGKLLSYFTTRRY
ncbi:hypothetical protein [Bdellovibrio sp. HCB288]|uniref:hypothetical protein n=1 Tax=Bdellovibrio sp. HCB288 TaxID=3394355 RepID=UPI0039B4FF42